MTAGLLNSKSSSKSPVGAGFNPAPEVDAPAGGQLPASGDEEIVLARLGRPRGLKGEIWLHVASDRPDVVLAPPGPFRLRDGRSLRVEALRPVSGGWTWVLEGKPARELVAQWTNALVVTKASELPPRSDGEFAEHEIIGMQVVDDLGRERGHIVRVEHRYEIDTWILQDVRGREGEIPAVARYIRDVDRDKRLITVTADGIVYG